MRLTDLSDKVLTSEALLPYVDVEPVTVTVAGVVSHAQDDVVLAAALSARADSLVTGGKELRQLGAYGGTRPFIPREFLAVLDRDRSG